MSWHSQVTKVTSKANRTLGFVKRNIKTPIRSVKEKAYQAIVRPSLEYASSVWDPHQKGLIQDVEKVQRRAARYVMSNYDQRASVTEMTKELGWETLEQRSMKARVTMCYRIIHQLVAIPSTQFIPTIVSTRGSHIKFIQIQARTNYYKYTFFPAVIPLWNSLPPTVAEAGSLEDFKKGLADVQLAPGRR